MCLSAYDHQDLPFEQLVEELQPERSLSYNPLFQVGFALQNTPLELTDLPDLELRPLNVVTRASTFDLSLFLHEGPDGISGQLEYNTDLFDATTIARMIGHFQMVLAGMTADPDQSVAALPLLTEPEQQQLATWNDTAAAVPLRWVHERFEAQAMRTPDAIALVFADSAEQVAQLSYAELNCRANQLAHHLRSLGAAQGVRVALCVERSPDLVIGLLAILKAGAAYVPLDPEHPGERLQFMLADAAVPILVTRQQFAAQIAAPTVVCLDRDHATITAWPEQNPGIALAPDTLAYVIYTSGSTGQPKGVLVEHQQLAHTLFASQTAFRFSAADRMPCIASFSFDIALFELFCPLLAGGSVVLMTKQQILDLPGFARTLETVTVLHTLPSLMRHVVGFIREHKLHERYHALRQVFVGGDAVAPDLLAEVRSAFPAAQINVLYGPTEATIICATHTVPDDQILNTYPIGKPLSNSILRLYDPNRQLVPVGVPGELYIGGAGVTRGYLQRQALTDEQYVWHDGQRWYRSGDLARYLPDGTLEFLGRIDQQVKIRGFRLELGEIEAVLNAHPAIQEAVVLPRTDLPPAGGHPDPRLVGYIVPAAVEAGAAAQSAYVDDWQLLYDETYAEGQATDPTFHIVGWHSSYTQQPFPPAEMREWRDATVERIRALRPQRILEIGCGTGLLLFALAGECARYHGIDFSAPALAHIRRHLPPDWTHVTLAQQRADELTDLQPGSFDTVILNSVAQYFPSVEYLVEVIARAITLLAPGGRLFIGDVRSSPLLDAFATAVTLAQAAPDTSRAALWAQIRQQVAQERELLLDPAFFYALRQVQPRISAVQVEIKRGRAHNELTQFRYDVTLTVDGPTLPMPAYQTYEWSASGWTIADLRSTLQAEQADAVLVRGVPSARVQPLAQAVTWLQNATGPATAGELRAAIDRLTEAAVEPEEVWALGTALGYQIRLGWNESGATGSFDAVFSRADEARLPEPTLEPVQPWSAYATDPAAKRTMTEIAPRLRQYLQTRLPEYMIPSAFVTLPVLPLTPNGKVDRAALPAPVWNDTAPPADALPRTPVETLLAEIWQQVLGVPTVGVHANFFELGGHSLLATQVISRIRAVFGLDLPVRALFEHPTIAELSTAVAEAQRVIGARTELPPLTSRPRAGDPPLSFAQQRLWFIEQLQPGTGGYHVAAAWEIHGTLEIDALQASLDVVVARHESLRTTFMVVDEQPVQRIARSQSQPIKLLDLSALEAQEQATAIERQIQAATGTPFDLAAGPLLRAVLLRRDPQTYVFVLVLHHIITDGWSMGVMIREIVSVYLGAVRGQSVELPPLPIQYADYAVWQRSWLQNEVLERQLAYWRKQLAELTALHLPTDRPHRALPSYHGAAVPITIDAALVEHLHELSRRTGTTLFMILLAAWQILLARYSGQDDIAVGTPIAGRTRPEIEPLIGFFVNTLVLRARLAGNPTFGELLAEVRATTLDAYAHQDAPFEAVVEALQPERDTSRTPLFQVMFSMANTPLPDIDLPEIRITAVDQPATTAVFDLTLQLFDTPSGVGGTLEYALDLFEAATIERMAGHFQTLLAGVVANPDARIAALPLLTADEQQQILHQWNRPAADSFHHTAVHQLIEDQAARTPNADAVVFGDQTLTYAALNARANQLAHLLIALGVGPDMLVALCLERSLEMAVGVLAVLKAGGAYLPLDPAYPAERLRLMLDDAPVVITHSALRAKLPYDTRTVLCLDQEGSRLAQQPTTTPRQQIDPQHLAYVIYTSGSTGRPKGVGVSHGALATHCHTVRAAYGLTPQDRLLLFASPGFDVAVEELILPLCFGSTLVLRAGELWSPAEFTAQIAAHQLTIVALPPVYWRPWVQSVAEANQALPPCLRLMIVGGEAMPPEGVVEWRRSPLHGVRLLNGYGPTETTITATLYDVDAAMLSARTTVPIGRPLPGRTAYILGSYGEPVPIGVAGELYLGGDSLARGYLNRPDLTAEKFVPDPFGHGAPSGTGTRPGARLYRTGDLARYLPDGVIEFVGRIDQQVKIRGFRIELGEIEAILALHPAIAECVVVAREDTPGGHPEHHLIGYVVPRAELPSPATSDLRQLLAQHLPEYMIPVAFVTLQELPKTVNGKLDRKALPKPDLVGSAAERPYRAARSAFEIGLAELWQALLQVEPIGIDDNFFRLGGHSVLAIRLMEQIYTRFRQRLPMAVLFEDPTIAHLAACLEQHQPPIWSPLVPIQPHGTKPPIFCVHGLGGSVFNYVELGQALGPDQPFYGLQALGLDDDQPPHTSIEELATAYLQAIRAHQPQGPYYLSGWSFGGMVAFEMAQQLLRDGEQVALLALIDSLPGRHSPPAGQDQIGDLLELAEMYGIKIKDSSSIRGHGFEAAASAVWEQAQIQDPQTWLAIDRSQFVRIARLGSAHLRALACYRPGVYPGSAILFPSSDNRSDPAEQRAEAQRAAWVGHIAGEVEVMITPGTHWTMLHEPHIDTLAAFLTRKLIETSAVPRDGH
jgi:amino acid adenylation domain-containing protein